MELSSPFVATLGDLVVRTPEWPAALAVLGFVVLHAGAIEAAISGRGAALQPSIWRPVAAFTVAGGLVGALLLGPSAVAFASGLLRHGEAWAASPHAAWVFAPLIAAGCAASVWAAGLAALVAAWSALTRSSGLGRALLLVGVVGMAPFAAQMGLVIAAGPLPALELATPGRVHVGRSLPIVPELRAPERWDAPPVPPWTPSEAGTREVRLSAGRGAVTVERAAVVEAGEELGDPRFPLQVGQRIAFADYSQHHTERVLFTGGRMRTTLDESVLTVIGVARVDDRGPVRTFDVVVRSPSGEVVEHRVFAWNGEVLVYDGESTRPFLGADAFLPLPGTCAWDDLPGPSSCTTRREGSVGNGIARAFLLVVTIGLVDPGSDASTTGWSRVAYEPGPPDAPSAPVAARE